MDGMDDLGGMEDLAEAFLERDEIMARMAHVSDERKVLCRINVLELFADMDPDHLDLVCEQGRWDSEAILNQVVNDMDDGKPYPTTKKISLKRKRDDQDDQDDASLSDNAAKKWDNAGRRTQIRDPKSSYTKMSISILQQFFPQMYVENLKSALALNDGILYPTYLFLSKATATGDESNPIFKKKKGRVPRNPPFLAGILDERIRDCRDDGEREALEEVRAVRAVEAVEVADAVEIRRKEQQELDNFDTAKAEGTIADCGCCFVEYAINRMVHCDGEEIHFFCRNCARTMAETQIGMAKHELNCMSTDGCAAGFARDQREIFLDAKSRMALEQIEMDASIRAAGIDNIERCPFCPFAAEYPDLELDREFRCIRKDCGIVSCRACRKETHIPKTCEEAALEQGHSARHGIEEAMSEALIRKCNKCAAPFIKEHGCNKMACTKCGNIQCYVCSKSCDYSHFNDTRRGGKVGNCELFDKEGGVEARHQAEVKAAEEEARKKVQEENKDLNPELLKFKESENIKQDETRRKQEQVGRNHGNADHIRHVRHLQGRLQEMVAMRREVHGRVRAVPPVVAPGRVEGDPPLPPPAAPSPQAAHARAPVVQEGPPRLLGPAHVARQELAMDPAYIWGGYEPARQAQAPAPAPAPALGPAPAFGVPPAPGPQVGYGIGHMMQLPQFGNDALDQALAPFGPAMRRGMPPHNYFDGQDPQVVANQTPHRAARVAPKIRPMMNVWNGYRLQGPVYGRPGYPLPRIPERPSDIVQRQSENAQHAVPNPPSVHSQGSPGSPPPEQPRGDRGDPIVPSSPISPALVDLTIEDDGVAERKLWDIEEGRLWPNLLDRQWFVD